MKCPECGQSLEPDVTACPGCGTALETKPKAVENPFGVTNPFIDSDDPEQQLRYKIQEALADDVLTDLETDELQQLATQLGLSTQRSRDIFSEEMGAHQARAETGDKESASADDLHKKSS